MEEVDEYDEFEDEPSPSGVDCVESVHSSTGYSEARTKQSSAGYGSDEFDDDVQGHENFDGDSNYADEFDDDIEDDFE